MDNKENTTPEPQATKPAVKKTVTVKKQRYFVPSLGREVEAANLAEVEKIVNKEKTKGQGK